MNLTGIETSEICDYNLEIPLNLFDDWFYSCALHQQQHSTWCFCFLCLPGWQQMSVFPLEQTGINCGGNAIHYDMDQLWTLYLPPIQSTLFLKGEIWDERAGSIFFQCGLSPNRSGFSLLCSWASGDFKDICKISIKNNSQTPYHCLAEQAER